jgi:hypothetical protein
MSQTFKMYKAKNTFGVYNESLNASEYIRNKRSKNTFCSANKCRPNMSGNTQGNLLLLNNSNYLNYYQNNIDKTNLYINLLTTLNLSDVSVIQNNVTGLSPTSIDVTKIPYLLYTIDPLGSLFGVENSTCGANNYQTYLQYNQTINT